ncbi:hypothetical protein JEZ13_12040 [bacterium]|nr:hypothetical protein [bacterium]
MNDLFFTDVLSNSRKGNDQFNDELIQYLTDRINAKVDIPFINEELERIIIHAILKIVFNLLLTKTDILNQITN